MRLLNPGLLVLSFRVQSVPDLTYSPIRPLKAKILHSKTGLILVGYHGGAPILKILYSPQFNTGVVNIYPVILKYITFIDDKADYKKVSISQHTCRLKHLFRCAWFKLVYKFSEGHTAHKVCSQYLFPMSILFYFQCFYLILSPQNTIYLSP